MEEKFLPSFYKSYNDLNERYFLFLRECTEIASSKKILSYTFKKREYTIPSINGHLDQIHNNFLSNKDFIGLKDISYIAGSKEQFKLLKKHLYNNDKLIETEIPLTKDFTITHIPKITIDDLAEVHASYIKKNNYSDFLIEPFETIVILTFGNTEEFYFKFCFDEEASRRNTNV